MPDLDTTIADGDPGHALLHQDANIEVNSLRGRMATAETTISGHTTSIAAKYTKPAQGIPQADLDTATRSLLSAAGAANVRAIEWTGNLATVRPSTDPGVTYLWIKRDSAVADPPIDDTYVLAGTDILLRATSA